MFLYGRFGHHNQNDRSYKLYKKWVTDENTYAIMHNTFHKILIWVVAIISNIAVMTREELQRHQKLNQLKLFFSLDTFLPPS